MPSPTIIAIRTRQVAVAVVTAVISAAAAASETTPGLQVETIAELRVVVDDISGATKFVPAERLRVGDEIFYTVQVRNPSATEIRDVVIVRTVPNNTALVPDSAVGPAATVSFSTDGGVTFAAARERQSGDPFTHIRWQLRHPLAPGALALLRFRSVFK